MITQKFILTIIIFAIDTDLIAHVVHYVNPHLRYALCMAGLAHIGLEHCDKDRDWLDGRFHYGHINVASNLSIYAMER